MQPTVPKEERNGAGESRRPGRRFPRRVVAFGSLVAVVLVLSGERSPLRAAEEANAGDPRGEGTEARPAWVASRLQGSPEAPPPYRTERVFERLQFDKPLDLVRIPGTDRLLVLENDGKLFAFQNDSEVERAELLIDLGRAAFGIAAHPHFEDNGFVYVTTISPEDPPERGTHVSRLRVDRAAAWVCDVNEENVVFKWPTGGHNGGCLQFGPEGYLYIATGDGSGIADGNRTGQNLEDVRGAILRIDVDPSDGPEDYTIPSDNPFVALAGARREIWAYGLRQVWRMSFDRDTDELWAGNVGQDLWEQVYRIERGGNYGWSITEGSHPFRPERDRGPSPILPPLVEHDHTDARSLTGGFVYRGARLPELRGAYVYGDYDTGRIWSLRHDGKLLLEHKLLAATSLRIVAFCEDTAGELYLVDHMGGGFHQLVPNDAAGAAAEFPRRLSETGLFDSVADLTPAPGVIPYSIHSPIWSDGAAKEFLLALPGAAKIEIDGITYPQPAPGAPAGWKFPNGTVLAETLFLDVLVDGEDLATSTRRRLETRILVHERLSGIEIVGDQYWKGYTYVWNDEQTDAVLLEEPGGLDRTLTVPDPESPAGIRDLLWHFPGRTECTVCHNMAAKYVLGVNTLQMNRDHDYGGQVANQLERLEHLEMFTAPLADRPQDLARLANYQDEEQELDVRARAYLHANCAYCHRKWGGGNAAFQFLATLPLNETGLVNTSPAHGTFGIREARVLAPGAPERSVFLYRIAKLGSGHMPKLGPTTVDFAGVQLLSAWIDSLPGETPEDTQAESTRRDLLAQLHNDSLEGASHVGAVRSLLKTTAGALFLARAMGAGRVPNPLRSEITAQVVAQGPVEVRDVFEPFLPPEQRSRRLGSVVDAAGILELQGDVERGRAIFFEREGLACKGCHQIAQEGVDVGPNLSQIGAKYDRARLLESILEPSKEIDPRFATYVVQSQSGEIHVGLLVERTEATVVLKGAQGKVHSFPTSDVAAVLPQGRSLMPDLLLRDLTAAEVADLVAFLASLR